MVRAFLALALIAAGPCSADSSTGEATASATLVIHTSAGDQGFTVQVADTPEARETGLMSRERLDPYDGMAFVWDEPVNASFWMKDTLIPLSIAFWDSGGSIVAILDMDPCTADPCPTYDPGVAVVGAVEVQQGEFDRRGIEVGDEVELTLPA